MSLFSENVVPGKIGKIFSTDAKYPDDVQALKDIISKIDGIKEIEVCCDEFPFEITITTTKIVPVTTIEVEAKKIGFHLIPKEILD